MSSEENGLLESESDNSSLFISNFSNAIVDGLSEGENNNGESANLNSSSLLQGLPRIANKSEEVGNDANLVIATSSLSDHHVYLKQQQQKDIIQLQSVSLSSPSGYSSLEGTSLESGASTVSFLTQIEIALAPNAKGGGGGSSRTAATVYSSDEQDLCSFEDERAGLTMESNEDPSQSTTSSAVETTVEKQTVERGQSEGEEIAEDREDGGDNQGNPSKDDGYQDEEGEAGASSQADEELYGDGDGEGCGEGEEDEEEEDDDTTTLSSEAVVDDIELILMPEMCHDLPHTNLSPKLVRVTELKLNVDDVFCDDDDDDDQSGRHDFRSIVDEVCEEDEHDFGGSSSRCRRDFAEGGQDSARFSFGDDDVSSGSELISSKKGASGARGGGGGGGESSKSSSSDSRRRRSTSGRISSGVQTDITALEEPSALSSHYGFKKKSSGKSSSARLGIPVGGGSGKKLNWKSELTLLPSKMKVKQTGFNSFESNDERDQYSPRVAKFTSQDTLNLSSQFLKPSTLYRTRNLSRNLNQFASSESTFMLPMSSDQQLSTTELPRFRDRVSSSTSGGNFKGGAASHSYSAYQISSILSGGGGSGGGGGGGGMGYSGGAGYGGGGAITSARRQPLISGYSGGGMMMSSSSSRHFRSSMPDLNAVNKSYSAIADSHRRRQPSKSIRHHHSSSGFRLQKRSSSDEETSSLIDESERCLRSSIDLLLTDELPSPGGDSCFRSTGFGSSSLAATTTGWYSGRRTCSQPILNDQAYPPEMKDPSMGSPFLPRKLSDMRCSRWAKVILPNGHVAVVSVRETDEIQDSLTVHTDSGSIINLPFRKVVFAWKTRR